jgi:peptide chain release factor 1
MLKNEKDKEILELAKTELEEGENEIELIKEKLKIVLLPKDPNDDKNIFIEIRPAA